MNRCLITGGAGFIGSNLAKGLLSKGYTVRILDNLTTGYLSNLDNIVDKIEFIEGDIRNTKTVDKATRDIDFVFHHAAMASVPQSIQDPISNNEININGTLNILNYANKNGVKRVIIASSSAVYGDSPLLPKHENMIPNPLSPYAVSKLACEYYGQVFNNLYDIDVVSLRYFNVFGPNQDPKSEYSAVIPKFIELMLNNRQPTIYDDGSQSRDFVYIDNIIHANLLAMTSSEASGKVFNVGGLTRITVNDLFAELCDILKLDFEAKIAPIRKGDIKHSYADISLIQNKLGYSPLLSFNEGLAKTIQFYQSLKNR